MSRYCKRNGRMLDPEPWWDSAEVDDEVPALIRDYVETCDSVGKIPTASEFIALNRTPGTTYDYDAVDGEIERVARRN